MMYEQSMCQILGCSIAATYEEEELQWSQQCERDERSLW